MVTERVLANRNINIKNVFPGLGTTKLEPLVENPMLRDHLPCYGIAILAESNQPIISISDNFLNEILTALQF